jgi:hypothetical protein
LPTASSSHPLDAAISAFARKYAADAVPLFLKLVRLPVQYLTDDRRCGMTDHEAPRVHFLKQKIEELESVLDPNAIRIDEFGSLIWTVTDPDDTTPINDRKVISLDGHLDMVEVLQVSGRSASGLGLIHIVG